MKNEMLELLHSSHQGIEKTKARARESLYWPRMNQAIEHKISTYATCAEEKDNNQKEPLMPMEIPELAWTKLGIDIFTH